MRKNGGDEGLVQNARKGMAQKKGRVLVVQVAPLDRGMVNH